jgi:putative methyltransferase (TIGR04325 family)
LKRIDYCTWVGSGRKAPAKALKLAQVPDTCRRFFRKFFRDFPLGASELIFCKILKAFTPPIVISSIGFLRNFAKHIWGDHSFRQLQLTGSFDCWEEAVAESTGYDAEEILQKTATALRKVKHGDAVYERDSVLFDEVQYAWPLLAALMWVAARCGGKINVMDFGGSLGSTYFQNRAFLDSIQDVRWNIVEQLSHVLAGQREFQNERLRFFESIDACVAESQPDLVLLSGVLQYLERPYDILDALRQTDATFLLVDRTPFWSGSNDRLCVQNVPAEIYCASYPSWIFSLPRFRSILSLHWDVISEFDAIDKLVGPVPLSYRGLVAVRRFADSLG